MQWASDRGPSGDHPVKIVLVKEINQGLDVFVAPNLSGSQSVIAVLHPDGKAVRLWLQI